LDPIDYYNLVSDKWLSQRDEQPWERPEFRVLVDEEDRKHLHELRHVTFGEVKLFIKSNGGEVVPIELDEAMNLPKDAPDRAIVNWPDVIGRIIEAGEYYSAQEVCDTFVKNEVKVFRTKSMLDKAVDNKLLARFWHQRKYLYGRPIA